MDAAAAERPFESSPQYAEMMEKGDYQLNKNNRPMDKDDARFLTAYERRYRAEMQRSLLSGDTEYSKLGERRQDKIRMVHDRPQVDVLHVQRGHILPEDGRGQNQRGLPEVLVHGHKQGSGARQPCPLGPDIPVRKDRLR